MTPWVRVNINDKGCHVRSIAPFCHIAFYVTRLYFSPLTLMTILKIQLQAVFGI